MLWPVMLKVPPGTRAGQHLRLGKRGLPKPHGGEGDLFAIVQIVGPTVVSDAERLATVMVKRYAHFAPEQLREAAAKLATFSLRSATATPQEVS